MNDGRKIYAKIITDEQQIIKNCELHDISDNGIIAVLENEFGWLGQSGFNLENAILSDDDDPDEWARYIDYVMSWAFEHVADNTHPKVLSYSKWAKNNLPRKRQAP